LQRIHVPATITVLCVPSCQPLVQKCCQGALADTVVDVSFALQHCP
jgi:hypothetical protein